MGDILSTISLGDHRMLVYADMFMLNDAYRTSVKQYLAMDMAVIIFTHYESLGAIRYALQELDIDVAEHEQDHSLSIMDGDDVLSALQIEEFINFLKEKEDSAVKGGKQGLGIVIDVGSFFHLGKKVDLEKFELECDSGILAALKCSILCCYHLRDLEANSQDFRNQAHSRHAVSYVVKEEN